MQKTSLLRVCLDHLTFFHVEKPNFYMHDNKSNARKMKMYDEAIKEILLCSLYYQYHNFKIIPENLNVFGNKFVNIY